MELSFTAREQTAEGAGVMGAIDQEFCVGNVDFEMPIRRSSGDIHQVDGFMSVGFREEVWAADINLKVVSIDMV